MNDKILNKKQDLWQARKSTWVNNETTHASLATTALLAKNSVPYSHRRIADNYVIIKRVYKFQAVMGRISNLEKNLLKKYDFNTLECTTLNQMNEEIAYLKKWSTAANDELRRDADEIMQIRAKELKYLVASKYALISDEVFNGFKALERYFEEITKFYS